MPKNFNVIMPHAFCQKYFEEMLFFNTDINFNFFCFEEKYCNLENLFSENLTKNIFFVKSKEWQILNRLHLNEENCIIEEKFFENESLYNKYLFFLKKCSNLFESKILDLEKDNIKSFFLKKFNSTIKLPFAAKEPSILIDILSSLNLNILKENQLEIVFTNLINLYNYNQQYFFSKTANFENNETLSFKKNHFVKKSKQKKKNINILNSLY